MCVLHTWLIWNVTLHTLHLKIPRPPSSTLFPYTTLFRSCYRRIWMDAATREFWSCYLRNRSFGGRCTVRGNQSRTAQDRKSTRLNSSHGYISYAVFCLKKKISLKQYIGHG